MKRLAIVVGLASVLAFLPTTSAQTPTSPEYLTVATVKVRPATSLDFEDYIKKLNAAAAKIGLKTRQDAYQTVHGGSPFEYGIVSSYATLGEFEAIPSVPSILIKAHGEAEGAKILRAGRAAIESVETSVMRFRAEFSSNVRSAAGSPFFHLVQTEIDPEMLTPYEDYLRKSKAAADKMKGAPAAIRYTTAFGQGFTYVTALPFNTWAEREKWPSPQSSLVAAYGEAEARALGETSRKAIVRQTQWIVIHRRDLSRIPTGTTN